jgi:hypothetical protein
MDGSTGSDAATETGGGDGGTMPCNPACTGNLTCCNGMCVNAANDPYNCGACGTKCVGMKPYCDGTCQALPTCMADGGMCPGGAGGGGVCCGDTCCMIYELCCKIGNGPKCYAPSMGQTTCPKE